MDRKRRVQMDSPEAHPALLVKSVKSPSCEVEVRKKAIQILRPFLQAQTHKLLKAFLREHVLLDIWRQGPLSKVPRLLRQKRSDSPSEKINNYSSAGGDIE